MRIFAPLLILVMLFFPLFIKAQQIEAVIYNGAGQNTANRLIAMTVAGIVNRDQPRLYLLNVYETWSYNLTDETWRDIYESDGNVNFTTINNINDLVQHFSEYIEGAITYDPNLFYGNFDGQSFPWQGEAATLLGSLTNCIPLAYNNTSIEINVPDSVEIEDYFNGQESIKVSAQLHLAEHPWNDQSLSQEDRYFEWLDWALSNLLNRTNPAKFYLREITDWAVSQRMFQLNLAGEQSLQFSSLTDAKASRIEQVMTYMQESHPGEVFNVYGWMRPEPLVQWVSAWGGSFHETLLGNLSWHHIFPADDQFEYDRPSAVEYEDLSLDDKYYVLFLGSEGDAGNWNFGFQAGAWLSPSRGNVPLGWGFNLHFFQEFPFIGQYYFRTATANDGFISVTSPLGYAYNDMFPDEYLSNATSTAATLVQKFNIPSVYAYKHYNGAGVSDYRGITISNNYNFEKLASFAAQCGIELTFLFDPGLATQQVFPQYESLLFNHVNDDTFYANVSDLSAISQRIINKLINKPRPGFLLAGYQRFRQDETTIGASNQADITLPRLQNLMDLIQSNSQIGNRIEFVTPEKFTWLLKRSIAEASVEMQPEAFYQLNAWVDAYGQINLSADQSLDKEFTVRVVDTAGRIISQQKTELTGQVEILPFMLPSRGVYILHVYDGIKSATQKVVY